MGTREKIMAVLLRAHSMPGTILITLAVGIFMNFIFS